MMDNHFKEFVLSSIQGLFSFCLTNVPDNTISGLVEEVNQSLEYPGPIDSTKTAYIDSYEKALSAALAVSSLLDGLGDSDEYISGNLTIGKTKQTLGVITSKLGGILRAGQRDRVRGLYVIIDPEVTGGRDPFAIAKSAVSGGARVLQLRDKIRDKGVSIGLANDLQKLCSQNDVLLIINDHVDVAVSVQSGGVHLGQTDLPPGKARSVLRHTQLIGRSNREYDQLIASQEMDVDHVAFGPIYATTTKTTGREPQGAERLSHARSLTTLPLVAIGGINISNIGPVIQAGADSICVTAAVGLADDPEKASHDLVQAIVGAGGKV